MPKTISSSLESQATPPEQLLPLVPLLNDPLEKSSRSAQKSKARVASAEPSASAPSSSRMRWKEIADAVRGDIESGLLAVGDLLPSETALTEQWKVSRMTAHRAMQELQRHGLVTRQRGRGTLVAENVPEATGNIALLFHNPLDLFEIEYIRGINLELANKYQLILCDSRAQIEQEAHFLKKMPKEADGIICMPSAHPQNTPLLRKIVASGYPIVCVDRVPQNLEIDAVVSDNFAASTEALHDLVARGHRTIAHFTEDELHISAVHERYEAFIQVAKELGEPNPERLVRLFPVSAQKGFESMVQLMHDALFTLLHQPNPPTAIFCLNDYCLSVLLVAMERLEICFPQDMEVLTFHDALTLMPSVSVRLHRIVQNPRKIGQLAAEKLKIRMANRNLPCEVSRVRAATYSLQADFPTPSNQQAANRPFTRQSESGLKLKVGPPLR